jgi:ATP-binding cassette, subfamily B, bacterial
MADRIYVLEGGSVVEQGSHEALVGNNGRYAKLFALQAQGYL